MKCYNHHDRDAFGVCKSCGKGLCLECLKEDNGVILCKNNKICSSILNRHKLLSIVGLICLLVIIVLMIID